MLTFIEELVDHLLLKKRDFEDMRIILPSKRAGTLFRRTFVQKISDQAVILPQIASIEELTEEVSELLSASRTQLQFEMYRTYLSVQQKNPESFLEFLGWSGILIGDFNEIDRYLLPTDAFFNYLAAVKDIERWSPGEEPTSMIKEYVNFWNSLSPFYSQLYTNLKAQGLGYQGMQYREAAKKITSFISQNDDFYIFAGFNALNTAEQEIIQAFLTADRAEVFWDVDSYFLTEYKTTIGRFINDYKTSWPYYKNHAFLKGGDFYQKPKSIKSVGISQRIGQAKYICQLLSSIPLEDLDKTAIVLGDEALLLPVLNSLPDNVTSLNITMGLPLNQVPDAAFFESWFYLHEQMGKGSFYYKNLIAMLQQGYAKVLLGSATDELQRKIETENLIYVKPEWLLSFFESKREVASLLFSPWENHAGITLNAVSKIIDILKNHLIRQKSVLQLEYLFAFRDLFNQLKDLINRFDYVESTKTLYYFYKELLSQETLDFRGDPYSGLQIMGVLESRVLDFKNVIVTGLNEGTLPAGKTQNSFIPFDLKVEYNLPTYREKDAIYSYHFFRLLQRSVNVYLLYNNEPSGLNSAEKSRFLLQLETEDLEHEYVEVSANADINVPDRALKTIKKTPDIINRLKEQAAFGFSPSALTTYIRNPLDFYYRYVLQIKELDVIEEVVAHNTLGTVVHEALENLYKPYLNTVLSIAILQKIIIEVPAEIERQFEKSYNPENFKTGKNLIIFKVAVQFVKNILHMEVEQIKKGHEIIIKNCEQKLEVALTAKGENIKLRGTVDRLDKFDGITRIIDYKTGKVEARELKITDWDLLFTDYKKHAKAFQVLCYALMLKKTSELPENSIAGIISFKNLNAGFLNFEENKNPDIDNDLLSTFEGHLTELIAEILDEKVPFKEKEV